MSDTLQPAADAYATVLPSCRVLHCRHMPHRLTWPRRARLGCLRLAPWLLSVDFISPYANLACPQVRPQHLCRAAGGEAAARAARLAAQRSDHCHAGEDCVVVGFCGWRFVCGMLLAQPAIMMRSHAVPPEANRSAPARSARGPVAQAVLQLPSLLCLLWYSSMALAGNIRFESHTSAADIATSPTSIYFYGG